jgi:hypothetical protein
MALARAANGGMMGASPTPRSPSGRHDFRIVHLTLVVFLVMHGFQQIVTQVVYQLS